MDQYPDNSGDIPREHVELTAEVADMYEGFLAFLESDSFSEWLEQTIGRRKLHIRKIVLALIQDKWFSPVMEDDHRLPQELYTALSSRLRILVKECLLVRVENSADIIYLRYPPPAPISDELPATGTDDSVLELPRLKLDSLEDRIRAAHIGAQIMRSSSTSKSARLHESDASRPDHAVSIDGLY